MPYNSRSDLSSAVKTNLDEHLQDVWLKVFEEAYGDYDPKEASWAESRDAYAFSVAWSAVKKQRGDANARNAAISLDGFVTALSPTKRDVRLLASAGIDVDRRELLKFAGILVSAEENKNHDAITVQGVKEICDTLPLMPVDVDHVQDKVVGFFTKAMPVDDGRSAYVEAVVYARRFPEAAQKIVDGKYKLSVEAFASQARCSTCGETFVAEGDYCNHLQMRLFGSGATRELSGMKAFGGALTEVPAGSQTVIEPHSIMLMASSITPDEEEEMEETVTQGAEVELRKEGTRMPDEEKQPEEQGPSAPQATDTSASAADASQTNTRVEAAAANEGDADKSEGTKVEGSQEDASKDDARKDDEPKDGGQETVLSGGQSDEQMPCSKCIGGMCLNASCAMYAAVSKPDAELIAARKAVLDAEAKLVEANKAIASLESEKSGLEARLATVETQLQQSVVAHRMAQLGQIMTAEQIDPYKERVGLMSETDFNLVLAAATNAPRQTTESPKPGSLRGTFVLSDKPAGDKDKADRPKSFQGLFSNIEAR